MAEELKIPQIISPADKSEWFLAGFLAARPIPMDDNGEPVCTVEEHLKRENIKVLMQVVERGHRKLLDKSATIVENALI